MVKRHNPSGSRLNLLQRGAEKVKRAVALGTLGAVALSGCTSNTDALPVSSETTQSVEATETPASTTIETLASDNATEVAQQEEYSKPANRPDHKDVIQSWYNQDETTIRNTGESDAPADLVQRAIFTAALYVKFAEGEESVLILGNDDNKLFLGDGSEENEEYIANPLFGTDILTCDNERLDTILSAQFIFPRLASFDAYQNGESYENANKIGATTFRLLWGHTTLGVPAPTLGFHWAAFYSGQPDKEPVQRRTRTVRISDEDVEAIDLLSMGYKAPAGEQYPSFWVMMVPRDDNPDNIALIQQVTAVPLSDAEGQIPDFDGNSWQMEYFDPGTPVSKGHPKSEVTIPVVRVSYIVSLDDLPEQLR